MAFKVQNKKSNKKQKKLPLLEEKRSKSNFGNIVMPGNASVMYLGTMEECVSSLSPRSEAEFT